MRMTILAASETGLQLNILPYFVGFNELPGRAVSCRGYLPFWPSCVGALIEKTAAAMIEAT